MKKNKPDFGAASSRGILTALASQGNASVKLRKPRKGDFMAKQAMKSNVQQVGSALEIAEDQWITFFAEFTRENRGAHARVEVLGTDVGYQVETDNRPFDGAA